MLFPPYLVFLCGLLSHVSARSPDTIDWRVLGSSAGYLAGSSKNADADNTTQHRSTLSKRDDVTIANFAVKGQLLDCLMQSTEANAEGIKAGNPYLKNTPIASSYTTYPQDLINAKWFYQEMTAADTNYALKETKDARTSIGGGAANDADFWGLIDEWTSPAVVNTNGQTTGSYQDVYGPSGGVILAAVNSSPVGSATKKNIDPSVYGPLLPQPNAWSDVVFLRWTAVCDAHDVAVGSLQHVFRVAVTNDDTLEIIDQAVGMFNSQYSSWSTKVTYTPPAPGSTTITEENTIFYALLETPNVRGVCWFLIQHKSQLGLKYIDQISLWAGDGLWDIYIHIANWPPT